MAGIQMYTTGKFQVNPVYCFLQSFRFLLIFRFAKSREAIKGTTQMIESKSLNVIAANDLVPTSSPTVQMKNVNGLPEVHPKGEDATLLLTSVFGPYAVDDQYGSRKINPMELYHNQVTREQGPFSLRMFHRTWGQMLIQANLTSPCTNLDFPTRERFIEELKTKKYDVIGIGSIIPNIGKVKEMCRLIRQYQPQAVIVVGGHISNVGGLEQRVDCDFIVRGDGVRWFREYLNQNPDKPLRHPVINSGFGTKAMGIDSPGDSAATIIPSVGCPMGCNFCATSAMFGGKGKFVNFYETGDELYYIMDEISRKMNCCSFFMMDENFLLHKPRAMRLLELMKKNNKSWAMYVFSSVNALVKYSMEELVQLGISWVWIGLEGEDSQYNKLSGVNVKQLMRDMQENGIRLLGSSIIGLPTHTPENISRAIDYAVSFNTDFHQFMLYTPNPGTPLFAEMTKKGLMKDPADYDLADTHGQYAFNYKHEYIKDGLETEFLRQAFQADFDVNGPSLMRLTRTLLNGWLKYKNHPDKRVVDRWNWEMNPVRQAYIPMIAAMRSYYKNRNDRVYKLADKLLADLLTEFGNFKTRLFSYCGAWYLRYKIWQEEKRLNAGVTYEPPTFYQRNEYVDNTSLDLADAVEPLLRLDHRFTSQKKKTQNKRVLEHVA